jgi:Transcriptional regulator
MGRRKETSEYLKECVADAMIKLMRERHLDKITVQEIADLAGIGRMSYFRYFSSKTDVLVYKLLLLWNAWGEMKPYPYEGTAYEQALWFFSFCHSIRPLLTLIYRDGQNQAVLDAYSAYTAPISENSDGTQNADYRRTFFTYGMYGVVTEWAKSGFLETPAELARICVGSFEM